MDAIKSPEVYIAHSEPFSAVLFWVFLLLSLALLGRAMAGRFKQPGVLGELCMGVFIGNIGAWFAVPLLLLLREGRANIEQIMQILSGQIQLDSLAPSAAQTITPLLNQANLFEWIRLDSILDAFAHYGLIFLLCMAGLETSVSALKNTGRASMQVAILGVVVPMGLGFLIMHLIMPSLSYQAALFVGATLAATSVGITTRVFFELKQMHTLEAKTILGAAVIDDILGLILLALISAVVMTGQVHWITIVGILAAITLFFILSLGIGPWFLTALHKRLLSFLDERAATLFTGFLFASLLAWLAIQFSLAALVGAFVAGLLLNEMTLKSKKASFQFKQLLEPIETLFVPLFFMLIGIEVKLESLMNWHSIGLALALSVAAILGKLIAGFGASSQQDRLLIGMGMIPRGEVGLIFASIGRGLGIISDGLFSAIILMVMITTFITPPLLKQRYQKRILS